MSSKENKSYYVTTPIYYVNGLPHVGNTYTTTVADTLARFHKFCGYDSFFLTGTDEHGDKIQQAAEAAGKPVMDFVTEIANTFKDTWVEFGFEFSRFIRTTDKEHKATVNHILNKIHDKGDIYFGEYGGNYCFGCERFLTDKELVDGKCPDHQKPTTFIKEKNYFFRMSKYQAQLLEHIEKNPDFIRPERYRNEIIAMLKGPLEDLCISRPKSRLQWGIELPFDKDYVTYVWFDALINYLSGIGYPDENNFKKYWSSCEHLIAKDILKPHGVFWSTMLMAAEIPLYKHLNVHGYWVTPTGKMSKSLGNVIDPKAIRAIKTQYGMDVFRYFVLREMVYGLDGTFNYDTLETRYNADLANNLGNLVSRSLAMVEKYRSALTPKAVKYSEQDVALKDSALATLAAVKTDVHNMELHRALEKIWQLIDAANVYIDRTKPWTLAKEEKTNADKTEELNTVLYCQLEVIRFVASLISPFMPESARKILLALGYNEAQLADLLKAEQLASWGMLPTGQKTTKQESLFPRIDVASADTKQAKEGSKMEEVKTQADVIANDEFAKVDLRIAQILAAEKVEKSEKLIKLQVTLGELGERQIVAGIGKRYQAEELVGRKIVVVANLKPAKLMGLESQGMLLAADDGQGLLELVGIDPLMPAGSKVR
ncbi:MAG: methionine--tRNA ligase [Deltaproteobacteria bacterium]|nr:methionine--tRNA ligase [Deltaproteobacteria bacterium]